ncbi:MAG: HEAT repeat domain-containing protein [Armatimonadota bacterium]
MTDSANTADDVEHRVAQAAHGLELLTRAARQRAMYPEGHPAIGLAVEQARAAIERLFAAGEDVEIALSRGRVAVNGHFLPEDSRVAGPLGTCLREKRVSRVAIRRGIDDDELIALLDVLGMEPDAVQERGGAQALVPQKEAPSLSVTEIEYGRYVRASDVGQEDGRPPRAASEEEPLLEESGLQRLRDLLSRPDLLAQHLSALSRREAVGGGVGGPGDPAGVGIGPGTGGGIGTGGDVPLVIGGREIDAGDRGTALVALSLQRAGEMALEESPERWEEVRKQLVAAFRLLDPALQWRALAADVAPGDARVDVLAEIAAELSPEETAGLVPTDAADVLGAASAALERVLRRLAPDLERLRCLSPVLRERFAAAGLDESAYDAVVEALLRDLSATYRGPEGEAPEDGAGFRGADESERRERRAAIGDLVERLSEDSVREARITLALELLGQERKADEQAWILEMLERDVGAVLRGGRKGVLLAVCETLDQCVSGDTRLDEGTKQRARELLWKVRGQGVAASVVEALRSDECRDRRSLILVLGQMGDEGQAALVDLIRRDTRGQDHEAALSALARLEGEQANSEADEDGGDREKAASLKDVLLDPGYVGGPALVEALVRRDDEFAMKYLTIGMTQGESALRAGIVRALGEHGGAIAVDLLILGLQNSDATVREMSAAALGKLGDHRAADHLLRTARPAGLFDRRSRLRAAAMLALGALRYQPAVPFLIGVLRRPSIFRRAANDVLRTAAAQALESIGDAAGLQALLRARNDRCGAIREIANRVVQGGGAS